PASSNAHGPSARTRTTPARVHVHVVTTPASVPGGRQILDVPPATSQATMTWPQWAALLLDRLHAPRCANNMIAVVAWEQQEGSRAGWNPLDTTYDLAGASAYNGVGVRNYPTVADGLDATVLTLEHGW